MHDKSEALADRARIDEPEGMTAFLKAHVALVHFAQQNDPAQAGWYRELLNCLKADLGPEFLTASPAVSSHNPDTALAVRYVISGSRLGAATLAKRFSGRQGQKVPSYLKYRDNIWQELQSELAEQDDSSPSLEQHVVAAQQTFDVFCEALERLLADKR